MEYSNNITNMLDLSTFFICSYMYVLQLLINGYYIKCNLKNSNANERQKVILVELPKVRFVYTFFT